MITEEFAELLRDFESIKPNEKVVSISRFIKRDY